MTHKEVSANGEDSDMLAFLPAGHLRPGNTFSVSLPAIQNIVLVWLRMAQPSRGSGSFLNIPPAGSPSSTHSTSEKGRKGL